MKLLLVSNAWEVQSIKKGLPCRKCKGTGLICSKEISEVVLMVREEVRQYCTEQFRDMFKDYMVQRYEEQKNELFNGVICDGCDMTPIRGIRFMCSVCANFDLCESCERVGIHSHHPMLKVRKASQAPAKLICQYKHRPEAELFVDAKKSTTNLKDKSKKENVRYSARFIKENFPDMFEVAPGSSFTKIWTMRNDGATAWPEDVVLIQTNGDNMGAYPVPITESVPAQGEYDWVV